MKLSIYNSYIKLSEDQAFLFNSKSNEYLIFDPIYISDFNNLSIYKLPSELKENMKKGGFLLLDDDYNETTSLIEHRKSLYADKSKYILTINPTLNCNLNCWYCYETKDTGKMSDKLLNSVLLFIENTIENIKELKMFELSFFGGEPLLCYKTIIQPCIKQAKLLCKKNNIELTIGFTTNAYLLNDNIINDLKGETKVAFQITLDGNRELHNQTRFLQNKKGTYDTIVNNIKKLVAIENIHTTLRFNCTKENLSSLIEVLPDIEGIDDIQRKRMDLAFERVWQDYDNGDIKDLMNLVQKQFEEKGFFIDDIDYLLPQCGAKEIN